MITSDLYQESAKSKKMEQAYVKLKRSHFKLKEVYTKVELMHIQDVRHIKVIRKQKQAMSEICDKWEARYLREVELHNTTRSDLHSAQAPSVY